MWKQSHIWPSCLVWSVPIHLVDRCTFVEYIFPNDFFVTWRPGGEGIARKVRQSFEKRYTQKLKLSFLIFSAIAVIWSWQALITIRKLIIWLIFIILSSLEFSLQFGWFKGFLPGTAWFKFISTTPGCGSVISTGTNKTLMWFAESWVTQERLLFPAV